METVYEQVDDMPLEQIQLITQLEVQMKEAAKNLEFEEAACDQLSICETNCSVIDHFTDSSFTRTMGYECHYGPFPSNS